MDLLSSRTLIHARIKRVGAHLVLVTNEQLYLAIGVPMLFNAAMLGLFAAHVTTRFNSMDRRFDDMRDLWRAELRRVEEVLDARLRHLEGHR